MGLSIDDFQVVADERNNTADILDREQMKVDISLPIHTVSFLIGKDGRVIEINGHNVEALLYEPIV